MGKKASKLNPLEGVRPKPPPHPPCRTMKDTFFCGLLETKESIRAREDYEKYMQSCKDGFESGINSRGVK